MRRLITVMMIFGLGFQVVYSQEDVVRAIFSNALQSDAAYENLRVLCETTEGRIAGSPAAAAAVELTRQMLLDVGIDTVYLQEVQVPNWKRGEKEIARITSVKYGGDELTVAALGLSPGTGPDGIAAKVIELKSLDELEQLGREVIEGKIVFFNRAVDQTRINTFGGYSGAVDQRFHGPARAAEFGAAAAVIRSVTTATHDFAHTGVMRLRDDGNNIPAVAVSTTGADLLSRRLRNDPDLVLYIRTTCYTLPDAISHNVIGEIWGDKYPDEIITVGGHLDAWDISQGAHDDGGGCMQAIDVLRIFTELEIKPSRTIRAVMFMDEEISQSGGRKYAEVAVRNNEKHYFALESDRGVFTPKGFSIDAGDPQLEAIRKISPFFEPYGITEFVKGFGGVDILPLKNHYDMPLAGLLTDSQRYFDLHHSANDTFEQVNRREMQLGSAAIASLIFLLDALDVLSDVEY